MLVATSTWNEEWIKNSYKRILVKKSRKRGEHEKQEIWKFTTIEKERKKGKKNKEIKKERKEGRNKERKRVRKKERKKDINAY